MDVETPDFCFPRKGSPKLGDLGGLLMGGKYKLLFRLGWKL